LPPARRLLSLAALAGVCLVSGCAIGVPKEPTHITATAATLNAQVSTSFGGPVTYWFKYGTTTSYGAETAHRTIDLAQNSGAPVSEPVSGLNANTKYHWQVCSQDGEEDPPRVNCSSDESFEGRNVSCGETITRSIHVTNDPGTCSGAGLIIGADNITLDLNGHTIGGGIRNSGGFDGVTIENGTVHGVALTDAASNRVRDLTVNGGNSDGIVVSGASTNTLIADNQATSIRIALLISASSVDVERNVVSGLGLTQSDKIGPLVVVGDDNRVAGNTAKLTHIDGVGTGVGRGSIVVSGDRNQILGNTASDSVLNGIVVELQAADTLVRDNLADSNGQEFSFGDGILVESASTSLGANSANANAGYGINATAGVTDLGGNTASGNGTAQCRNVVCQ
jgi:parallel beta-helix repeat protein